MTTYELGQSILLPDIYITNDSGTLTDADSTPGCTITGPDPSTPAVTHVSTGRYRAAKITPTVAGLYVVEWTATVAGDATIATDTFRLVDQSVQLLTPSYPDGLSSWSSAV